LGDLAVLLVIWTLVEVAWGPMTRGGVLRAKIASLSGLIFILASWVVAGIYYIVYYGPEIKPLIKEGPWPWAHAIFMEAKEHIFLFLPFLALLFLFLVWKYKDKLKEERGVRFAIYAVGGTVIFILGLMAICGYLISSGYRAAIP